MSTPDQTVMAIADYLACHQRWGQAVKPLAIVYACGGSQRAELSPFYTPHLGWQDLNHSPAAIALFLIQDEDWKSADPERTVDEMLLAIKHVGRDAFLVGKGEPMPPKVCEMAKRLEMALHTESYAWN